MGKKRFKTEVAELLHLIIHSLYSNPEIFIRELISNSSDAIDKLKFLALTELKDAQLPTEHRIDIKFDEKEQAWLSISDSGVGMDQEDLERFLGTIANSGTRTFFEQRGEEADSSELIGKFGVGFYSAFMVAESVTVTSHKAGQDTACQWRSQGVGTYEILPAERDAVGTEILIHLNKRGKEFANAHKLKALITRYSDHISHGIYLTYAKEEYDEKGNQKPSKTVTEKINSGSAIWKRAKADITEKEYEAFYQSLSYDRDPPLFHLHLHAEGAMEYAALLYVPKVSPPHLYYTDFQTVIRLYIQRVFITDDQKILLPNYLRFVRGVIDSEDLPLNVSREILQDNALLTKIQNAIVKKFLNKLGELAGAQPQIYENFVSQYNRLLKEGLYQDFANRDQLLELVRFRSTYSDGFSSLSDYQSRTAQAQKYIYYLAGTELSRLRNSPLLEPYKKQGIEVLLLDDDIDELVIPTIGPYKELTFRPINRASADEDALLDRERDKKLEQRLAPTKQKIADVLRDRVAAVEFSARLDSSPACVVFPEHAPSARMKEMLKGMGVSDGKEERPTLEINAQHALIQSLERIANGDEAQKDSNRSLFGDLCHLLLEQSLLVENIPFENSHEFVARINRLVARAMPTAADD